MELATVCRESVLGGEGAAGETVFQLGGEGIQRRPGGTAIGGDGLDGGLDLTTGGGSVTTGSADQIAQMFKLVAEGLQIVRGENLGDVWLHLTHNAAYVLAALNVAFVAAGIHEAGVPAQNAPQIVADAGIADVGIVDAIRYRTAGVTGDAAGVGGGRTGIQTGKLIQIQIEIQIDPGGVDGGVNAGGIYRHVVFTALHGCLIVPHDATGAVFPHQGAVAAAIAEGAVVDAADAAGAGIPLHGAGEGAVFQGATVGAHDAAHGGGIGIGGDGAGDIQVLHHGGGLQLGEQSGGVDAAVQVQSLNGVAIAPEHPAEGGHADKAGACQRDVGGEQDFFILGPGVQLTVFGKQEKVFGGLDGDGLPEKGVFFRRCGGFVGEDALGAAKQNRDGQKKGSDFTFHRNALLLPGFFRRECSNPRHR